MFTADLRRGEDYEKAKRCIVITFLDFELEDCVSTNYHNVYMLRDQNGNLYTDVLELHTIELKKKPHKEQPCPLDEWHCLFNAETEEDLDMIKSGTKNLGIIEAIKELKEISLTDRLRYEHEMKLKAKRDRRAEDKFVYVQGQKDGKAQGIEIGKTQGIEIGKTQGIEIGKTQGIEIGKAQGFSVLIDYMRNNGLSDEQIITELMVKCGLSREEASALLH